MKGLLTGFLLIAGYFLQAQGVISGQIADEGGKSMANATVLLASSDSLVKKQMISDESGAFRFADVPFGYYKLVVSYTSFQSITIDSLNVRAERYDFQLNTITLKPASEGRLEEIIIYAEKPLIESKDGNITFNASESALSAGSSASDLLTNVPLISKDPNGKILVRGKEPKILIDDKPVNLNLQQLQDLLESIPGSSVEKIEVLTNPPPQYANEQGGVINIVTKKGTVGMGGRISINAGTRGELGGNTSFNYRTRKLTLNLNAGANKNQFGGFGYSIRENIYKDSTNHLFTNNHYTNENFRPNLRLNMDYEVAKLQSLNVSVQLNGNHFDNTNSTLFRNQNRTGIIYKGSERTITSIGDNGNQNFGLHYTIKTARAGESLKINTSLNFSHSTNDRKFYQQFFNADLAPNGSDSTQTQLNDNRTRSYSLGVNYDRPFFGRKTFFSAGATMQATKSAIAADANYKNKVDGNYWPLDLLSNQFTFYQQINTARASLKQLLAEGLSVTAGLSAEQTSIKFQLSKMPDTSNNYLSFLPFATFSRSWKDVLNLNIAYRRSIRRPGIQELNPTIDFSDPYNIRFGNPQLEASTAHNFDIVIGRTQQNYYTNVGVGYNIIEDIFSPIRSLQSDGKTQITWQNISGKKEYEVSTWNGYTFSKKWRVNMSASYTWNQYSDYDIAVRKFRNGGSFTSNLNTNYTIKDLYTATGSFTMNRFANPQGTVKNNLSMNLGVQGRFFNKKLTVSLNAIDPIIQQENRVFTYATNFNLENYSSTNTRNYRIGLSYNLAKTMKPKPKVPAQKNVQPKQKA